MTFGERNQKLQEINTRCAQAHDKYTSGMHILTDSEWRSYIASVDAIAKEYVDTSFAVFAGRVAQAYLDDTEEVQKKLKEVKKG